jgi:hypothetical protein
MFAGLGVIVVDCCSVEKEVMQKGWKKINDFFVARIRGSGGMRVPPVFKQKMAYTGCNISRSRTSDKELPKEKCVFLLDIQE